MRAAAPGAPRAHAAGRAAQLHFKETHEEQMARVRADARAFGAFMRTPGAPEQYYATHRLLYGRPDGGAPDSDGPDADAAPSDLRASLERAGCEVRAAPALPYTRSPAFYGSDTRCYL